VVAVYTTSFKAQWLLYVPPRVTFGSLIHISPAQYRRTCLWPSYDSRNSRVRQYIDPLVRVMNMFAVRRGPTFTLPSWVRWKEIDVWNHHAACVHVFVPPFEQSNEWTNWFSRNLVWALSRWKSPSPRTFFKSSINSNNYMADVGVLRLERHSLQLRWGPYIVNGSRACRHVCLFVKVVFLRSVKW